MQNVTYEYTFRRPERAQVTPHRVDIALHDVGDAFSFAEVGNNIRIGAIKVHKSRDI